jgi:hypothetical protein
MKSITPVLVAFALASLTCNAETGNPAGGRPAGRDTAWRALVAPDNSLNFMFLRGETRLFNMGLGGWGPNWGWVGIGSTEKATGDELVLTTPFAVNQAAGQIIAVKQRVWQSGPQAISFRYELSADKDVPLTALVATVGFEPGYQVGDILFKHADGAEGAIPLTIGGPGAQPESKAVVFRSPTFGEITATVEPAQIFTYHGGLRVMLAAELFKAGTKTITITFNLPGAAALLAKQSDIDSFTRVVPGPDWFPVTATRNAAPSVIGFEKWLDKPAGKHGGVRMVGDHFEFANGTRVKFWGSNLSYALSAPEKPQGEYTAARFAKFGVNAVRLHKFTGPTGWEGIGDPNDVTKMMPDGLDRLDAFANALVTNGIYYGWSHTFKMKVQPGNKDRLLAYDEIKNALNGSTYALINYAEDCQDLMIEMVVNLLRHKNPYTGSTYAQDPALAFIELQNEDDIFFFTTETVYNQCPTYARNLRERFAKWLQAKYQDQAGLQAAWGDALKADETLAAKNIAIQANPWSMGADNLRNQQGGNRTRLLDNAAFFHDVQNAFYSRFAKAIRDTGYQGALIGSPWQAPSGLPHYYNLKSDYNVGYIDRHNYFGGGFSDTMLIKPGSGYFSSGLQQVVDRPFGLSEWIHVYPSLYSAEGPAILAVYGMGLQGWDASYEFQSGQIGSSFGDIVGNFPWGVWNVDMPTQLGQYPALARMIMRGDVKEGEVIGVRNISPKNLAEGSFDFSEQVSQQGDVKSFTGNTPEEALAAGRLVVQFTDKDVPSSFPEMGKYRRGSAIVSTTGQLTWDTAGKGYFTVNSKATKAVVGFAQDQDLHLADYTFTLRCPYASIFLTSLERNRDLSQTKSALLTAVARNSNSGFKILTINNQVIDNGKGPVLLEPVKADLACGRDISAVHVLDQDGQRTGRTLPVARNTFQIDSAQEQTIYYEVVLK